MRRSAVERRTHSLNRSLDVSTAPSFKAGTPKKLFKLPSQPLGNPSQWNNVSRDGQRFVFSMPAPR